MFRQRKAKFKPLQKCWKTARRNQDTASKKPRKIRMTQLATFIVHFGEKNTKKETWLIFNTCEIVMYVPNAYQQTQI